MVLMECINYCIENKVNYFLLSELSRLGSSTLQVLKSLEQLHESGVSVYIQNVGIHTLQPNGEVNPVASIIDISNNIFVSLPDINIHSKIIIICIFGIPFVLT